MSFLLPGPDFGPIAELFYKFPSLAYEGHAVGVPRRPVGETHGNPVLGLWPIAPIDLQKSPEKFYGVASLLIIGFRVML